MPKHDRAALQQEIKDLRKQLKSVEGQVRHLKIENAKLKDEQVFVDVTHDVEWDDFSVDNLYNPYVLSRPRNNKVNLTVRMKNWTYTFLGYEYTGRKQS